MTQFITYAQNFEDLMLWRALRGVAEGFYIDVGAADPDEDTVTRAFYDRGWHGINLEPSPAHHHALASARPRDICLRCLAGSAPGEARLHHFAGTGLSTTDDAIAARYVAEGRSADVITLPVMTLTEIWRRHGGGTVHFLKIDVEGAEEEVLRGIDFSVLRPWIVLAEATEPGSTVENWQGWDGILTAAEYCFCWFDGLNRFYIAAERWDALKGAFATPPNDQWTLPHRKHQLALLEQGQAAFGEAVRSVDAARREIMTLGETLRSAEAAQQEISALRAQVAELQARLAIDQASLHAQPQAREQAELALAAMRSSTSWGLTAPLRRAIILARRLRDRPVPPAAPAPAMESTPQPAAPPAGAQDRPAEEERMATRLRAWTAAP